MVSDVPKPMAPVAGRPFLEYMLDYWINQGIRRFVLSTGYLGHVIQEHFGNTYQGVNISYVHEQSQLGTGGALRRALKEITWTGDMALMANGDTWFPVCLGHLVSDAAQQQKPITIALKSMAKNVRYSGIEINPDQSVKAFGINTNSHAFINAGCYLFDVSILGQALTNFPETFSFENDFLAGYAAKGLVGSSIQEQPFLDIGIPEDYLKASELLK